MDADQAVANLARLLWAVEASQETTRELLELVGDQRVRLGELVEDVAALGVRVSELERERPGEHSLNVVGRERFRTLDELAEVLRLETSAALADITSRIDHVHERALRALTNQAGKGTPA